MKQIWKYQITLHEISNDPYHISCPEGTEILSVGEQVGKLCIWAIVDPDKERCDKAFTIVATGQPITFDKARFIGTVQIPYFGELVFHVFHLLDKADFGTEGNVS